MKVLDNQIRESTANRVLVMRLGIEKQVPVTIKLHLGDGMYEWITNIELSRQNRQAEEARQKHLEVCRNCLGLII